MKRLLNNSVSLFVVIVVLLIIIPLPPVLLDLLFIVNLGLSFIILLTTMNISEALDFSIFPSILLITTLFRLGLNASSTRSILLNGGEAGKVIETFGNFVIQGNAVVGLIIFLIIVLVQFVVITKGSERVAEVAARFTLDAMPGKQMAIDADLSSGMINEEQARERRSKIQREADFFGAMDGASKFVKGDSIISIVIVFINLIAGMIIGMMTNVGTLSEIASIYTVATVGDGLVSQLPALMISVATGMIVTRSASKNDLNTEIRNQFTSQPAVLIMAGLALLVLALIPGMPKMQIFIISLMFITLGFVLLRNISSAKQEEEDAASSEEITSETDFYRNIDNVYGLLGIEPIEMEFGYSLLTLVDEESGGSFIERIVIFRKQFALEMGMIIPSVRLKDSSTLNPNQYAVKFKGEEVARGEILSDHYLAIAPSDVSEEIEGIDTIEPAFGIPARWISEDKRIRAEIAGYTLIDPTSVIVTHLSEVIKSHAYELLTRNEVNNLLNNLKKTNEVLVNEMIGKTVSVADLQKVLANLLKEQVSIRDLETIVETLADYSGHVKDIDLLSEYVRQALKRTISRKFSESGQLKVITLDNMIENTIMGSVKKVDGGSYLALDPNVIQSIVKASSEEINKIRDIVQFSIVLTSPIVRIYYKRLIDQFVPNVVVLSFSEIDSNVQIQAIGNIST